MDDMKTYSIQLTEEQATIINRLAAENGRRSFSSVVREMVDEGIQRRIDLALEKQESPA